MVDKAANEYVILQRKLQELESAIGNLTSDGSSQDSPKRHQQLAQEIERRIVFLKNLLSAEMEVCHEHPEYLHQVAAILRDLETNFFIWAAFKEMPTGDIDSVDAVIDSIDAGETKCSCTYSCLNEEDGAVIGSDSEGGESIGVLEIKERQDGEEMQGVRRDERRVLGKKRTAIFVMLHATLVMVVIICAGFSMDGFCGRDGLNDFLPPRCS